MDVIISLPETFGVFSRDKTLEFDPRRIPAELWSKLALHGLTQKIADAASGAKKIADETDGDAGEVSLALMQKALDGLLAGEWAKRASSGGISDEVRLQRRAAKDSLFARNPAKSEERKKFMALSENAQEIFLDEYFAMYGEKLANYVEELRAEMRRKAERKNLLAAI